MIDLFQKSSLLCILWNHGQLDLSDLHADLHCLLYFPPQLVMVFKSVHSWPGKMAKYFTACCLRTILMFHLMASWFNLTRTHLVLQLLDPFRFVIAYMCVCVFYFNISVDLCSNRFFLLFRFHSCNPECQLGHSSLWLCSRICRKVLLAQFYRLLWKTINNLCGISVIKSRYLYSSPRMVEWNVPVF